MDSGFNWYWGNKVLRSTSVPVTHLIVTGQYISGHGSKCPIQSPHQMISNASCESMSGYKYVCYVHYVHVLIISLRSLTLNNRNFWQTSVKVTEPVFHLWLGLIWLGFYETFIALLFDLWTLLFPARHPVSMSDKMKHKFVKRQRSFIYLLASCKHRKALIAVSHTHKGVGLTSMGVTGSICVMCPFRFAAPLTG